MHQPSLMKLEHIVEREKIFTSFKSFPLFAGVPDEVLAVFFVAAQEQILRAGQVVVKEGDNGEDLYIIGEGSVDVVIGLNTVHQTNLAVLGKNDFFGEMCVIEPSLRSATVITRESTLLYSLKSSSLNKVYQIWPEQQSIIMANLARELAHRVQALDPLYKDRGY